MKVKCLYNRGEALSKKFGKLPFGVTYQSEFGVVGVGQQYTVMGIMLGEDELSYLIDDGTIVVAYPIQLFEVVDPRLPGDWFFRSYSENNSTYPYRQATWGYYELCFEPDHYERLIEMDKDTLSIYFRRKGMAESNELTLEDN